MENTDKLRKLAELVKRGVGGEAKNAEMILKKLLKKEGMSLEEFLREDDHKEFYSFRFYNKWDKELLFNIYSMVLNTREVSYHRKNNRTKVIWFELTKSQYVEIKYLYEIYIKALSKEFNRECTAFIIKNQIFVKSDTENSEKELTPEELDEWMKIYNKVSGTSFVPVRKAIEEKR